jgi:hypothetical protein
MTQKLLIIGDERLSPPQVVLGDWKATAAAKRKKPHTRGVKNAPFVRI